MTKTIAFLTTLAAATSLAAPALAGETTAIGVSETRVSETRVAIGATAGVAVTGETTTTPRSRADSLFYLRLGQSMLVAPGAESGPAVGLGYRLELDRVGIDASLNVAVPNIMSSEKRGYMGSVAKLTAQYYFMPDANHTPYLGGGLSWGFRTVEIAGDRYTGTGLQAEIVGGYEFLRKSNIRLFLQGNVSLPLYMANRETPPATTVAADPPHARYLPTMGISLGVAWGK